MYLSRLTLNPRDRDARKWLSDCNQLHRTIMSGFGQAQTPEARAELGVLYRVEETGGGAAVAVLVQSRDLPRWAIESPAVTGIDGPKDIADLARKRDPRALAAFDEYAHILAVAITSFVVRNIFLAVAQKIS